MNSIERSSLLMAIMGYNKSREVECFARHRALLPDGTIIESNSGRAFRKLTKNLKARFQHNVKYTVIEWYKEEI